MTDNKAMTDNKTIKGLDLPALHVIHYPDPRLSEVATAVREFGPDLKALADRMLELMFLARGVGLAGPQVGLTLRLFVSSPSFDPADGRVYVNPRIIFADGKQECDEGCLSLPGVSCKIKRYAAVTVEAQDADGRRFEESGAELHARIYQHEIDHLDGVLLINRMGTVARMANRKVIKELEEEFQASR